MQADLQWRPSFNVKGRGHLRGLNISADCLECQPKLEVSEL